MHTSLGIYKGYIVKQGSFLPGACSQLSTHAREHTHRLLLRMEMLLLSLVTVRAGGDAVRQGSRSLPFGACRKGFPFCSKRREVSEHDPAAATTTTCKP